MRRKRPERPRNRFILAKINHLRDNRGIPFEEMAAAMGMDLQEFYRRLKEGEGFAPEERRRFAALAGLPEERLFNDSVGLLYMYGR